MGCNYYIHRNIYKHCDSSDDPIHVGKCSFGWTFSFRGYRDKYEIGTTIKSASEWRAFIAKSLDDGCELKDECGDSYTAEQFWEMVDGKRSEARNHTTYCRVRHPDHAKDLWLDDEGNSFTGCEFS